MLRKRHQTQSPSDRVPSVTKQTAESSRFSVSRGFSILWNKLTSKLENIDPKLEASHPLKCWRTLWQTETDLGVLIGTLSTSVSPTSFGAPSRSYRAFTLWTQQVGRRGGSFLLRSDIKSRNTKHKFQESPEFVSGRVLTLNRLVVVQPGQVEAERASSWFWAQCERPEWSRTPFSVWLHIKPVWKLPPTQQSASHIRLDRTLTEQ